MEFNNQTRALTNNSGYVKRISDEVVYKNHTIYLGKYDNANNYIESTEEEYNEYIAKCLEESKKEFNNEQE